MPKVKFTALVADMKGKAQGSVFSNNSGGNYFRNNPSGGGRTSSKWDKQKSRFSQLAGQWRALTGEQQDAWNAAVTEYPTTNAFGDARTPSGYELFMRLNGRLNAIGLASLTTPASPRAIPELTTLDEDFPEEFQFQPAVAATSFDKRYPNTPLAIESDSLGDGLPIMCNNSYGIRVYFPQRNVYPLSLASPMQVFAISDVSGFGVFVSFIELNIATPKLQVYYNLSDGTCTITVDLTPELFDESIHIGFTAPTSGAENTQVYINGAQLVTSVSSTGDTVTGTYTPTIKIGNTSVAAPGLFIFSDIRSYITILSEDDFKLVGNGYVLNTEYYLFTCYDGGDGTFPSWSNQTPTLNLLYTDYEAGMELQESVSFGIIPIFSLLFNAPSETDYQMNIYATPPLSRGKNGSTKNVRLISSTQYLAGGGEEVIEKYRENFKNVPPNSQVLWFVQLVDRLSGNANNSQQRAATKRPTFKCGSELSGKVN